jgi:teichoic acid transport system permease protein
MTSVGRYSDVEYVFEAHSSSIPDLREYLQGLWDRRQFMAALARSDIRTLRSSTMLGNIWAVLDPLFQAGIYFFLYAVLRGDSARGLEFLPVLVTGIFLFSLSTQALNEGGSSIRRAKGLMLNSTFPRALLPVTSVYKSLRNFVPSAVVAALLFPVLGGKLGPGLLMLPLLFAIQVVMCVGTALLVSTFVVLVADATNVMTYVARVLFFATPVIYPLSLLPPGARLLISWQPLFALFASYQAVFSGQLPSLGLVVQAAAWAIALLVIGGRAFLRHERQFAMHL